MSLCRVSFCLTEELRTEALERSRFYCVFCLKHCRNSLTFVEPYYLFRVTVEKDGNCGSWSGSNTGSAWTTEQHLVATDKSLSEFPLQRYTLLTTNTLRESLSDTLPELEAFEVNDLLIVRRADKL